MTWHPGIPEDYRNQIVTGDARELSKRIPDNSIDLIFSDPPYPKKYLGLYDWVAKEAARVLTPTGFMLIYAGVYWKSEVMKRIADHMEYYFDFVVVNTGNSPIMWQRKIISRYKSILAYTKHGSGALPRTNVISLWNGSGRDKRYHTWGQDESSARYYIDCFSSVSDIIYDPFAGGGTTPAICKMLNRNYISLEIDPAAAEIARKRVRETQLPLFTPQLEQIEMMEAQA